MFGREYLGHLDWTRDGIKCYTGLSYDEIDTLHKELGWEDIPIDPSEDEMPGDYLVKDDEDPIKFYTATSGLGSHQVYSRGVSQDPEDWDMGKKDIVITFDDASREQLKKKYDKLEDSEWDVF